MKNKDFLKARFGLECEFTGITRNKAAKVVAEFLGGTVERQNDYYDTYKVKAPDGRVWRLMYDGSILTQKKAGRNIVPAGKEYSVELVSPILTYREDIETLQEIIRKLRKAGAFSNSTVGIHIHLDGKDHTPRSLRNFVNIIYARNDLLYESLEIEPNRMRYCKKMDADLVERMNKKKLKTFREVEEIWYQGYPQRRDQHYHDSRYHFLNLHSFFNGVGTLELRLFNNPNLHAGIIRSYIVLALALNNQALTQKSASTKKPQVENPKFSMRTWLNRIGFVGDEFKNCREHLCKHLKGSAAWRFQRAS
jgi:hypothetical protein